MKYDTAVLHAIGVCAISHQVRFEISNAAGSSSSNLIEIPDFFRIRPDLLQPHGQCSLYRAVRFDQPAGDETRSARDQYRLTRAVHGRALI